MPCLDHRLTEKRTLSSTELLGLRSTTNTTAESSERDDLLMLLDVPEVVIGLGQFQACKNSSSKSPATGHHTNIGLASESSSNFPHVLEVGAEVFTPRA